MVWKQVRSFDQSKGGKVKNACLINTRTGYGIASKHPSAWKAWQNTQQHTEAIPSGIDVPVFFSYWATIDGVYANWGHIGVRLANGQFWSDGTKYASIGAYEAGHKPRYVGWGESINGLRVIEQVNEPQGGNAVNDKFANEAEVKPFYMLLRGNEATLEERKGWVGKPKIEFILSPNTAIEARNNAAERSKARELEVELRTVREQFNALKESKPTGQGATQKQLEAEAAMDAMAKGDKLAREYAMKYGG